MSDQPAPTRARRLGPGQALGLLCAASLLLAAAALAVDARHQAPPWVLVVLGAAVGVSVSALVVHFWLLAPLADIASACSRVATGDLSQTVPEDGPHALRASARVVNAVLADFQEVLLLFAYFLRSARISLQVMSGHARVEGFDNTVRGLAANVLDDIRRMQEMIEGFKYFRVRIESDTITDTGVLPAGSGIEDAARGPLRNGRTALPRDAATEPEESRHG